MIPGLHARTLVVVPPDGSPGYSSRYAVIVPPGYDPARPSPAILFLHGRGESGTDGMRQAGQGLGPAALARPEDWPFIIVAPQKPDQQREWECFPGLAMGALDAACAEFNVDPGRVYLTGLSQGGHGTWVLASQFPGRFAAIAPVCGYGPPRYVSNPAVDTSIEGIASRVRRLPIWAFHGLKDDVVPAEGTKTLVDAVRAARLDTDPEPVITLFPDANHNSWDAAYRTQGLGAWFLKHPRQEVP